MNPIEKIKNKYRGKRILIVGLGLQGGGLGMVKFFSELGSIVTVTDKKSDNELSSSIEKLKNFKAKFHLGGHWIDDFLNTDFIFKGPSVRWDLPEIIEAKKKGIPIEMEMAFVANYFPGKIIGITGTRGKTTTTILIYEVLKNNGFKVCLGGNIPGVSNIDFLKYADEKTYLVAELSSWSLSGFHQKKISPYVGVFTNFYPDHLDYYKNMEEYLYDKKAIYLYQKEGDYFVFNEKLRKIIKDFNLKTNNISFSEDDFIYDLKHLKGDHNFENASAVLKVSEIFKISRKKTIDIIINFKGVSYRQEVIKEKNNIIFVNDSTSTTPTSTIKAIEAFKDNKIILILGGNSKNLPTANLFKSLKKTEKIVLIAGSFTDEILPRLKTDFHSKISKKIYHNFKEAVKEAVCFAKEIIALNNKEKVCILFSPGATSFSMFKNEFDRGDQFKKIVDSF